MRKTFYLSTCDTCKRILKEVACEKHTELQDIKKIMYTPIELDAMKEMHGTYEGLVNKRARKYKEQDIKAQSLNEEQYRELILSDYTFLKRPVIIYDTHIFVGNAKKDVAEAKTFFDSL